MSKLHILQQTAPNTYNVVVHAPMPAGNNDANITWAAAVAGAGLAVSVLPIGNGPGQITQSEMNQITSGTLIEAPFVWGDNPDWDNATRASDLQVRAQQAIDEITNRYKQ